MSTQAVHPKLGSLKLAPFNPQPLPVNGFKLPSLSYLGLPVPAVTQNTRGTQGTDGIESAQGIQVTQDTEDIRDTQNTQEHTAKNPRTRTHSPSVDPPS